MIKLIRRCIVASYIIVFSLQANIADAENVRGRLEGVSTYGSYPVAGVAVTLLTQGRRSAPTYSDNQGMYYIYNVSPGSHILEIWAGGPEPMTFQIYVYEYTPEQPVTDISPIKVR